MPQSGARHDERTYREFAIPLYGALKLGPVRDREYVNRIFSRLDEFLGRSDVVTAGCLRLDKLWCLASLTGLAERVACDRALQWQVTDFLMSVGWLADELEDLFLALERHRTMPVGAEECLIHDAQAMEGLGALGIARGFSVGAAWGHSYRRTIQDLREHVDGLTLLTPVGRRVAERAKAATEEFLVRMEGELRGECEVVR